LHTDKKQRFSHHRSFRSAQFKEVIQSYLNS
jgi:hypothetical protein